MNDLPGILNSENPREPWQRGLFSDAFLVVFEFVARNPVDTSLRVGDGPQQFLISADFINSL